MAESQKSRKRIMSIIYGIAALTLPAVLALGTASATPASGSAETVIDKGDIQATPAVKVEGFALPERRDIPGFEPVQYADAPWPGSAAVTTKAIAGRYALLRQGGKDTGCRLTLAAPAAGTRGGKGRLAPACRDKGVVIFDPASWQIAKGDLVLKARKGQTTDFDLQADGTWRKDPKSGKPLTLKKM